MKYLTKGQQIKRLKEVGIRRTPEGKKLEKVKAYEVTNLFFDTFGGFKD